MRPGDIVKLRYTGQHIWGVGRIDDVSMNAMLEGLYVLLYVRVPFNYRDHEFNEGYYPQQNIFVRGDQVICFSASKREDYIVSVHGNIFDNDNYLTFDEHSNKTT